MGQRFRFVRAAIVFALVCVLWVWPAPLPTRVGAAGDPTTAHLVTQPFAASSSFSMPVYMIHAGDNSGRQFVVEQPGRIWVIKNGVKQPTPFLDLTALVTYAAGGERGLFSIAFHPQYTANGYFYVNYTRQSSDPNQLGDIILARYHVSANPDVADPTSAQIFLTIPHHTYGNHNGGTVMFGPDDGYLYLSVGDGGGGGDPNGNGQNTQVLLAKLLRIDVDHTDAVRGTPYAIPPTNPFANNPAAGAPEVWAYGLRNPWRYSFDPPSHQLFIGDVGQNLFEEVDVEPDATAGLNYGWRIMEGLHCYNTANPNMPLPSCNMTGLTMPVLEYDHVTGGCAVIGGFVYRGTHYAGLVGLYLYADDCNGRIWALDQPTPGTWRSTLLRQTGYTITSFGEDQSGELYITTGTTGPSTNSIYHLANFTATGLLDSSGSTVGGNAVTIAGTGFVTGATVKFGATPATVQSVADGQLVVIAPSHATGPADVTITNGGYTVTLPNAYTYVSPGPGAHSGGNTMPGAQPIPMAHPPSGSQGMSTPLPQPTRH